MKKILISIIIILLIGLGYTIGVKSLSIGQLKLESVGDIKNASANLDQKFNTSKEISAKTYPKSIEDLDKVVRDLKTAKQQYQAKTLNNPDVQSNLGIIQVEKYNIEYLWTIIGNYATKNGVKLTLDIKSTSAQDVYNLNFSLEGKYIGITDFIYSLEDDSELKFEIKDFKISSDKITTKNTATNVTDNEVASNENGDNQESNNTVNDNSKTNSNSTNTNQQDTTANNSQDNAESKGDGITLYATFTVENVGINLNE
ncbi:unknown [Clostridium sp. CAG:452]|nr:unknown [Clostridium sp. CAG:452]